ncbi:HNH endonuclease signature motif containing protein, partial [Miniimonas arenae]|uniref:HNH endonuclease signature motif containing protein n=1 Tax=Miniimonas arenae TaxID=676201 RepID=UPI0028AD8462
MVQQSDAAVVGPEDGLDAEVVRVWDPVLDGLAAVPRDRLGAALAVDAPVDGAHHGALEAFDLLDEAEAHRVLNDGELLELAAAWARQAAAAHAHLLTWIARLATRPRMFTGAPIISPADATAAELQQRLGLGRRAAQRLVRDAHSLTGLLWPVHESLTAGLIDAGKASVFVDVLDTQPVASVAVVLEEVLPLAPGLSAHALRGRLCDALVHVDPDSAAERARTAATQRRVSHPPPPPHPDAMATFSAFLPAPTAHALDQVCESAARATPGAQRGGRTLEQLRADVLATLAEGALLTGTVGIAGTTSESFRFDPARARVRITATPTHQHGGRTPAPVDALSWEWDTPAGQSGRPNPYHRDREGRGDREGADGVGFAGDDGVGDHSGSASGGASESVSRCVPGVDVPELHGHGAYPPALLPALGAHAWIHLVPPVQLGDPPPPSPGYTPTAVLDTFVRHRDRTCQAPGCSVAARLCDLDHIAPWPTGTTSAENLRCLCRFHHTLKTHG